MKKNVNYHKTDKKRNSNAPKRETESRYVMGKFSQLSTPDWLVMLGVNSSFQQSETHRIQDAERS